VLLSVVQWSALTRILRELVSNAIAHSQARRLEISFQLESLWQRPQSRPKAPSCRSSRAWQLAQVMAYVPQAAAGYFPFTVLETVLMGRTARLGLFAIPSRRDRLAAEAALTALGINNLQNHIFTRLSGGQRQLTLIARALAQEPRILVMDEPTASLDFGNQIRVLDHIRALARRNIGIVLATHDPDHALTCADRVALLRQGRLIGYGPPADAITSASLWALYGVAVDVVTLPGSQRKICAPGLSAIPPVSRLTGVTR